MRGEAYHGFITRRPPMSLSRLEMWVKLRSPSPVRIAEELTPPLGKQVAGSTFGDRLFGWDKKNTEKYLREGASKMS